VSTTHSADVVAGCGHHAGPLCAPGLRRLGAGPTPGSWRLPGGRRRVTVEKCIGCPVPPQVGDPRFGIRSRRPGNGVGELSHTIPPSGMWGNWPRWRCPDRRAPFAVPRARLHLPAVASGDRWRSFAAAAVGVSVTVAGNDRSGGRLRMVASPRARPPEALGAPRWAVRRSPHQTSARPSRTWRRVSGAYLQAMSHLKPVWPYRRSRWAPT